MGFVQAGSLLSTKNKLFNHFVYLRPPSCCLKFTESTLPVKRLLQHLQLALAHALSLLRCTLLKQKLVLLNRV
jgi:hypothetical protein